MFKMKRPNSSNNLIRAIKRKKWDDVHLYLAEAKYADETNAYALHTICSDSTAPVKVLAAIYKEYPQAAILQDTDNDTPIAIAVDENFEDAVKFLANACPESVIISSDSSSPIQSTIDKLKPNSMFDSIVNANPEAAFIPKYNGESTFHEFCRFWNIFLRLVVCDPDVNRETLDNEIGHGNWTIRDVYQKSCLLLKAANNLLDEMPRNENLILHSSLKFESCHYALCKLILKLHPEQALKRDIDGNLPIHITVASKELSDEETFLCMDCFSSKSELAYMESQNGMTAFCCEDCFQYNLDEMKIKRSFIIRPVKKVHEMVKALMNLSPQMAFIPDSKGSYPLHLAIKNQHSFDIVCNLYKAFVEVGMIADVTTRLLPFMLAAVGMWDSETDQISIIFQLLREDPHLLW